jgi:hypothetical protein
VKNKGVNFLLGFVLMLSGFSAYSQADTATGKVTVVMDNRIERLLKKKILLNEKKKGINGYRVQIHFGSSRETAKEIKSKFLTIYKETIAYELYQQPNFKIRVGDFRTRLEAQKLLREIIIDFPNSFIVQDEIVLQPL